MEHKKLSAHEVLQNRLDAVQEQVTSAHLKITKLIVSLKSDSDLQHELDKSIQSILGKIIDDRRGFKKAVRVLYVIALIQAIMLIGLASQ